MKNISVCIPTWEQYGLGVSFLKEGLESIRKQSFKNFNVIISDHSKNDEIKKICESYENFFELKYFKFEKNYGNGPSNTNNALVHADGDIIKILFQDDFFYDTDSLKLISENFDDETSWLVTGCNHTNDDGETFYNPMIPKWNDRIIYGINTISSPSVLAIKNQNGLFFDENLTMLMDCEMYYNLYLKFGEPKVVPNVLVTNRMHSNQISSLYNKDINQEINYVKNKYKIT